MNQPHLAALRIARHRKIAGKADLGRIDIAIRQARERQFGIQCAIKLRRQRAFGVLNFARQLRLLRVWVRQLDDIIVLSSDNRKAIVVMLARQRLYVANMEWSEVRGHFNDHTPAGQLEIHGIFRIERLPVGGLGGCQDISHRQRFSLGSIRSKDGSEQEQEQSK